MADDAPTFEEFSEALDKAEELIVGQGMEGMDKIKWNCTVCGAVGVGIASVYAHYHNAIYAHYRSGG